MSATGVMHRSPRPHGPARPRPALCLWALGPLLALAGSAPLHGAEQTLDQFDSGSLSPDWQIVSSRGDVKPGLTTRAGWLRLSAASGQLVELRRPKTSADLDLLTHVEPGDLPRAGVVGVVLRGETEHAALLVSREEQTVVTLGFFGAAPGLTRKQTGTAPTGALHLCLRRRGAQVIGYWSADGETWEQVGSLTVSASRAWAPGLHLEARGEALTAQFDYFWLALR